MEETQHTFLEKFSLPWPTMRDKYKIFFIAFGALILIFRFRELIVDLLVSSSRKVVKEAIQQNQALREEEIKANTESNDLRKQAEYLANKSVSIGEDWNKK
jgi:hypothetical protein